MSKLFAVTGQNNRRKAGKRAVDTEILLRVVQSNDRGSTNYVQEVARMNFSLKISQGWQYPGRGFVANSGRWHCGVISDRGRQLVVKAHRHGEVYSFPDPLSSR